VALFPLGVGCCPALSIFNKYCGEVTAESLSIAKGSTATTVFYIIFEWSFVLSSMACRYMITSPKASELNVDALAAIDGDTPPSAPPATKVESSLFAAATIFAWQLVISYTQNNANRLLYSIFSRTALTESKRRILTMRQRNCSTDPGL